MKVTLNIQYDPKSDQHAEAKKLDDFRRRIYKQGIWSKKNGGIEILL